MTVKTVNLGWSTPYIKRMVKMISRKRVLNVNICISKCLHVYIYIFLFLKCIYVFK